MDVFSKSAILKIIKMCNKICLKKYQIHQLLKISVNRYTDFQKLACIEMKSVYTDLIDLLIFSRHQFVFSVHQFLQISVNRYTSF